MMRPGLWLDDLFIEEKYRKHGLGRRLISWLCREAAHDGCARIDWIVANENDNGKGFYERMGATIHENVRLVRLEGEALRCQARNA